MPPAEMERLLTEETLRWRQVVDAFPQRVSHDVLGMIGVGFGMISVIGALTVLGQTTQLTRHQPKKRRRRR